jgi:hypothetical protein
MAPGGAFYSRGERWALNWWQALTSARAPKQRLTAGGQSCHRCSYSAREARRRASGDEEGVGQSLTVGHAASHAPSQHPRSPTRGQGLDRVRRMKNVWRRMEFQFGGRGWAGFSASVPPKAVWEAFRGASGDALRASLWDGTHMGQAIHCHDLLWPYRAHALKP